MFGVMIMITEFSSLQHRSVKNNNPATELFLEDGV